MQAELANLLRSPFPPSPFPLCAPLQTILLVGIVTKVALVAVRWEHDHTGSHRSFHSSMLRQEFEGDLEGDSNSNAGLNDDAYDLTEGGAGGNGTGNASEAVHHQRGHARHRLGRGGERDGEQQCNMQHIICCRHESRGSAGGAGLGVGMSFDGWQQCSVQERESQGNTSGAMVSGATRWGAAVRCAVDMRVRATWVERVAISVTIPCIDGGVEVRGRRRISDVTRWAAAT